MGGRSMVRRITVVLGAAAVLVAASLVGPVGAEMPPVGDWAVGWGAASHEEGAGVAVDGSGNVYATGFFRGTVDFDPGPGTENLTSSGSGKDAFVSKLDSSGGLVWARHWGSTGDDRGYGIAVDGSGNVYTTGAFEGTVDFDPGPATVNLTSSGSGDVFVSKLDSSGNYAWARHWGSTGDDRGYGIAVDGSGNVHTIGAFAGTVDFDPGAPSVDLASSGFDDVFVSKLDSSGTYVWAKAWGATGYDYGFGITVDGSGNVYSTGRFQGTVDFDPGAPSVDLASGGGFDVFVSKLDSSGTYVWAKTWGATGNDAGRGIAVDGSGNVHTVGYFYGTVDFDPGAGTVNLVSGGGIDVFVSKLDSSGTYAWARHWGSTDGDVGRGITVDGTGNVYSTGTFWNTVDFDPGAPSVDLASSGYGDVFVSKLDSSGTYVWARHWGYSGDDAGRGIALDGLGNVHTTGAFKWTVDFDPGPGTLNVTSAGGQDVFVSKLAPSTCNGLPVTWDMTTQGAFTGTLGDDVVLGTDGPDVIDTLAGNDTVCGLGGDDTIKTGAGVDWVDGGDGNDLIRLGARDDTAYGGVGNDVINGGGGADTISGGGDDDVIWDSFGADTAISGDDGDDLFVVGRGDANHFDGGDGSDRVDYRAMPSGVTINLTSGTTARVVGDTFTSIEQARGSKFADAITGTTGDNVLIGYSGDDTIYGMGGDDNLVGDKGDDILYGGFGWDRLVGGNFAETVGDYCLEGENIHPSCEHTAL